jgi:1-acyl-sn-glycerol-3-phosphate acyltransferase|tara:strand:+ start:26087 stop:26731 length:645 start_codon:yes stop_codon:yes gene_type:complete
MQLATRLGNKMTIKTDHPAPKCNEFAYWLGQLVLKITGWRVEGNVPDNKNMIIIGAPHTSNWDVLFLLSAAYSFRLSIHWLVKDTWFVPGIGSILAFLGAVPVDRSRATFTVTRLAERIKNSDGLPLVVPPAGTRSYTKYWKSGFYRIAQEADVPVVCGFLDYSNKVAGLGLSFYLSGNVIEDMDRIREFYEPLAGKYPEKKSRILLKEEGKAG